jgi:hypothetical protein
MRPSEAEKEAWTQTKLVAYMWCCDDEGDGLCFQPRIERSRPNTTFGFPARRPETLWKGTFVNEGSVEEMDALYEELRVAAAAHGIVVDENGFGIRVE